MAYKIIHRASSETADYAKPKTFSAIEKALHRRVTNVLIPLPNREAAFFHFWPFQFPRHVGPCWAFESGWGVSPTGALKPQRGATCAERGQRKSSPKAAGGEGSGIREGWRPC